MLKRKKPIKQSYEDWLKKKTWRKKEKNDAKCFNGSITPRSGGMWNKPGDISAEDFLIDAKYTKHKSYSVNTETIRKIHHEAIKSGKTPALSVELGDGTEFVILRKDDFMSFLINNK